ncbi:hypothetical protein BC939DRAFT_114039 [Gamsiella multidivaricata]|uniref:uncharacterized protein n=1 Tax=Gamsiella multidivaricata TaxID=101098 RepID=UPI00222116A7|nr:uncharacterized protein BC939DRAFT_114039 [Gamsiella multidivaricata]KAI7826595.1 hypothetical protein BC939DRAFT_114039 [Gamsiella multidivaricata]
MGNHQGECGGSTQKKLVWLLFLAGSARPLEDRHDLFLLLRSLSLGCLLGAVLDAIESAVVDAATATAGSLKSLVVLFLSAPGGLRLHPRIISLLVYRLQVQRPLLVEQMSLDGIHHVVGRHLIPVEWSSTVLAEEPSDRHLGNKCVTTGAFLGAVIFINTRTM